MKNTAMTTDYFAGLLEEPFNGLIDEALAAGRVPIGYTCGYVPESLLSIGKLFPVRMRAPGVIGTETADIYLSSVICSCTRSLLEYAMEERYDFLGGWVFTSSCDHLRRFYDNLDYLKKPAFNHIIDVPHKTGPPAIDWYVEELRLLSAAISEHFNVDTGPDALADAIEKRNGFLRLLKSIGDLRKREYPGITGADFHRLLMACQVVPHDRIEGRVLDYRESLMNSEGRSGHRARLMVAGGEIDDPGFIQSIESQGGLVVADRFCTGSFPGLEPIAVDDEPLRSLAENVFRKTACPRMMEDFAGRVAYIKGIIEEYRVDGVIIEMVKFCDIWGIESSPLQTALRDMGIPVLKLDREYRQSGEGQLRTRVQAFLESMGR